jgi:predicted lipid-binding transport protein (Tim44 family)
MRTEPQIKFCKSCGHKLVEHARLLDNPEETEQANAKERLVRSGTGAMIGSLMATTLYGLICVAMSLFLPNLSQGTWIGLWFLLMLAALFPGMIGLVQLVRGGYFKNFREQQLQAELERLQERQKALQAKQQKEFPATAAYSVEANSVTEATTRELRVPVNRVKGEQ